MTAGTPVIIVTARMGPAGDVFPKLAPRRGAARRAGLLVAAASLLAALCTVPGCEEEEPATAEVVEPRTTMHFSVDPSLLGATERFEAFNVQFSPPAGWKRLPDEQMAVMASSISGGQGDGGGEGGADPFAPEPLAVFALPEQNVWLMVTAMSVAEPSDYEAALREAHGQIRSDDFYVHDIEVHQYLIQADGKVNFKLLLAAPGRSDGRRLQLDYVMPQQTYSSHIKALESSLGSMRPVGRKDA